MCLASLLLCALSGCEVVERYVGPIPFPIPPLKSDPGPDRSPRYVPRLPALPEPWIGSCYLLYECTLTHAPAKTVQRDTLMIRLRTSSVEYPEPYRLTVQLVRKNTNTGDTDRTYTDWDIGVDSLTVDYRGNTIGAAAFRDCEDKPRAKKITAAACWLFSFVIPDEYPSEQIKVSFARLTVRDRLPPLEATVPNIGILFVPERPPGKRFLL